MSRRLKVQVIEVRYEVAKTPEDIVLAKAGFALILKMMKKAKAMEAMNAQLDADQQNDLGITVQHGRGED